MLSICTILALTLFSAGCGKAKNSSVADHAPSDGPGIDVNPHPHERGDAKAGQTVFRFETFGNEGSGRMPRGCRRA